MHEISGTSCLPAVTGELLIYALVALTNHWHLVARPETSDQVSEIFRRVTVMPRRKQNSLRFATVSVVACRRGLAFGPDQWTRSSAVRLSLESTTRARGRPKEES